MAVCALLFLNALPFYAETKDDPEQIIVCGYGRLCQLPSAVGAVEGLDGVCAAGVSLQCILPV